MSSLRALLGAAAAIAAASTASAQLPSYDQNFEAISATLPGALTADGWRAITLVTDSTGAVVFSVGPVGAPNGPGNAYSRVETGFGGPGQGAQSLNVFNNYSSPPPALGGSVIARVYREGMIGAVDAGETVSLSFDYLLSPNVTNPGSTVTGAFIRVFRSSDGSFAPIATETFDTTGASAATWSSASFNLTIDPAWVGETVQYGFESSVMNMNDSERLYDNVTFSTPTAPRPGPAPFARDFEALSPANAGALSSAGWRVFADVRDANSVPAYSYGPFPAPNGTGGFSAVATSSQGAAQGAQSLAVFSDYLNPDHGSGFVLESSVFQERTLTADDVGRTLQFAFDYLRDPVVTNGQGAATTGAFLKVLQQTNQAFSLLGEGSFDTTAASSTSWERGAVELTISPLWLGELLQIGFENTATNFEDTGRFYDNLILVERSPLGTGYCSTSINSSGTAATISASGSLVVSDNDFTLRAEGMPENRFGLFTVSTTQAQLPLGNGSLCLGGAVDLFQAPGQVLLTGMAGRFDLSIDLTAIPQGGGFVATTPGQVWNFQAWFRDSVGSGSNLTNGLAVSF